MSSVTACLAVSPCKSCSLSLFEPWGQNEINTPAWGHTRKLHLALFRSSHLKNLSSLHCSSVKSTHMIISLQQRWPLPTSPIRSVPCPALLHGRGRCVFTCFRFTLPWNESVRFPTVDNVVWRLKVNWKHSNYFHYSMLWIGQERSFETCCCLCLNTSLTTSLSVRQEESWTLPHLFPATHISSPIYIKPVV